MASTLHLQFLFWSLPHLLRKEGGWRQIGKGSLEVCTKNRARTSLGGGSGSGVLERPAIEITTPGRESEFDLKKSRKLSPPYRVMLHNDNYNKREYVVQVLMKVIPGMTLDSAVNIMQEAHYNGISVVIICGQSDAEEHCMQLRVNGLLSSIEPASPSC
eukprot:c21765_g2_i1 orf=286-762(-)